MAKDSRLLQMRMTEYKTTIEIVERKITRFMPMVRINHENMEFYADPHISEGSGVRNYDEIVQEIEASGFSCPTLGEVASTIYQIINAKTFYQTWSGLSNEQELIYKKLRMSDFVRLSIISIWCQTRAVYPKTGGLFAVDCTPANRELTLTPSALEDRLGTRTEAGVVFSDDGSIRFTPDGFAPGEYSPSEFGRLKGVIALAGGCQTTEKIINIAEYYRLKDKYNSILQTVEVSNLDCIAYTAIGARYLHGGFCVQADKFNPSDLFITFAIDRQPG